MVKNERKDISQSIELKELPSKYKGAYRPVRKFIEAILSDKAVDRKHGPRIMDQKSCDLHCDHVIPYNYIHDSHTPTCRYILLSLKKDVRRSMLASVTD